MRHALRVAVAGLLAGCAGYPQSPLNAAGREASDIAGTGIALLLVAAVVYVLVHVALLRAVWRRRDDQGGPEETRGDERGMRRAVSGGVAATALVIALYLVLTFGVHASLADRHAEDPVSIEVVARQWWWEMRYRDSVPSRSFVTANELHVPVGRPIEVLLRSDDVIHSFWAPALTGKRDMVPGRPDTLRFTAERPGTWRGQCGEFCGFQHAHMAFDVVVHEPADFARWVERQRAPAPEPVDSAQRHGRTQFLTRACPMCHAVQGTPARGTIGPDLTHVAGRRSLAAGAIPNTPGHLAGWIVDPGRVKPGTRMPPNDIAGPDLEALLAWLRSLR